MATYLITGGAGFIGSSLVEALLGHGQTVRVLDNFATGRRDNLTPFLDRIDLVEGDICDPETVETAMLGVDYVLHQAALPSVARSVRDPIASHQVNVIGTLTVLLAARDAGVRRVVVASSSSVYGANPALPKQESMTPQPLSPYAISKLAAEQNCGVFTRLYGLETVALRYFNVFGPRQDPDSAYAAVIPRFASALLAGRPLTVHGDGTQSRDFTYIDNVVDANLLACTAPGVAGGVFNIAGGGRHSLLDLIDHLAAITGREPEIVHTDPRPGDVPHSQASVERARQGLGYVPQVDFREGLRRTVAWYERQLEEARTAS